MKNSFLSILTITCGILSIACFGTFAFLFFFSCILADDFLKFFSQYCPYFFGSVFFLILSLTVLISYGKSLKKSGEETEEGKTFGKAKIIATECLLGIVVYLALLVFHFILPDMNTMEYVLVLIYFPIVFVLYGIISLLSLKRK